MLITTTVARWVVKRAIRLSAKGESVNIHTVMKAIDALGDADGNVEITDVITAVSDYVSDIRDIIRGIVDTLDVFDLF